MSYTRAWIYIYAQYLWEEEEEEEEEEENIFSSSFVVFTTQIAHEEVQSLFEG